jgi:hypothetical protein
MGIFVCARGSPTGAPANRKIGAGRRCAARIIRAHDGAPGRGACPARGTVQGTARVRRDAEGARPCTSAATHLRRLRGRRLREDGRGKRGSLRPGTARRPCRCAAAASCRARVQGRVLAAAASPEGVRVLMWWRVRRVREVGTMRAWPVASLRSWRGVRVGRAVSAPGGVVASDRGNESAGLRERPGATGGPGGLTRAVGVSWDIGTGPARARAAPARRHMCVAAKTGMRTPVIPGSPDVASRSRRPARPPPPRQGFGSHTERLSSCEIITDHRAAGCGGGETRRRGRGSAMISGRRALNAASTCAGSAAPAGGGVRRADSKGPVRRWARVLGAAVDVAAGGAVPPRSLGAHAARLRSPSLHRAHAGAAGRC